MNILGEVISARTALKLAVGAGLAGVFRRMSGNLLISIFLSAAVAFVFASRPPTPARHRAKHAAPKEPAKEQDKEPEVPTVILEPPEAKPVVLKPEPPQRPKDWPRHRPRPSVGPPASPTTTELRDAAPPPSALDASQSAPSVLVDEVPLAVAGRRLSMTEREEMTASRTESDEISESSESSESASEALSSSAGEADAPVKDLPRRESSSSLLTPDSKKKKFGLSILKKTPNASAGKTGSPSKEKSAMVSSLKIVKFGVLMRKTKHDWKKRWIVLTPTDIHVFRSEADSEAPELSMSLMLGTVKQRKTHDGKQAIDVITATQELSLLADEQESSEWFRAIQKICENLMHISLGGTGADTDLKVYEISQEAADPKLKELLALPANKICADCGSPDPCWATINIGAFICISCSGVHRSLGVHITKVRSVTIDSWPDDIVEGMRAKGNETVNNYYEAKLAASGDKKINPEATMEQRKEYITLKYVQKKYVDLEKPKPQTVSVVSTEPVVSSKGEATKVYSSQDSEEAYTEAIRSAILPLMKDEIFTAELLDAVIQNHVMRITIADLLQRYESKQPLEQQSEACVEHESTYEEAPDQNVTA